ncbi:MAG: type II toxin-antitoxin system VapC family toxin [Acidobacteriaceae bacterium]|jgi:predicted nucleic acid-binding protein
MYLLDTNVISELRRTRSRPAHPHVVRWAQSVPEMNLFLSSMTIFELELGALQSMRHDPAKGIVLRAWIDQQVLPTFAGRILPVDSQIAQRCAALHMPNTRSERDAFIAATALVHKMTVVTRNTADFAPTGVSTLNPWEA